MDVLGYVVTILLVVATIGASAATFGVDVVIAALAAWVSAVVRELDLATNLRPWGIALLISSVYVLVKLVAVLA